MGKIIDATLSVLDEYDLSDCDIYEFIDLIRDLGIDQIQISSKIYSKIKGQLPGDFTCYLESGLDEIAGNSPWSGNIFYFSPSDTIADHWSIPTREFSENILNQTGSFNTMSHLKGFDSLIIEGSEGILSRLLQKISYQELIVTPGDSYHCANAIAYLFLQKDVFGVVTTLTGISNHASTEQVVMAQRVIANCDCYNVRLFSRLTNWFERVTEKKIPPNFPVLGEKIFHVESGVHVDGIIKNSSNYEPYNPALVGLKREIVLGNLSGRASIDYKLKMLLNQIRPKSDVDLILQKVKQLSIVKKGKLTDEEFVTVVKEYDNRAGY